MAKDDGLATGYASFPGLGNITTLVNTGPTTIFSVYVHGPGAVHLYDSASVSDVQNGTAQFVTNFNYEFPLNTPQDAMWNIAGGLPLANGAVFVSFGGTPGATVVVTYA